jgi:hypothetical protein
VISEPHGKDPEKQRRRRRLLVLPILLLPFMLGGLSVGLLVSISKGSPQGTPTVPSSTVPTPSAHGSQILQGAQGVPPPTPAAGGSGSDVAGVGGPNFSITGEADDLRPGLSTPIRLTLTNPNGVPIYVTNLTLKIPPGGSPAGCDDATNLQLTQSNASVANPIAIPARGSVTLTSSPRAPEITLLNLPNVNQDACKDKSFGLAFSGSAHS